LGAVGVQHVEALPLDEAPKSGCVAAEREGVKPPAEFQIVEGGKSGCFRASDQVTIARAGNPDLVAALPELDGLRENPIGLPPPSMVHVDVENLHWGNPSQ
jgi:hypothetical protein